MRFHLHALVAMVLCGGMTWADERTAPAIDVAGLKARLAQYLLVERLDARYHRDILTAVRSGDLVVFVPGCAVLAGHPEDAGFAVDDVVQAYLQSSGERRQIALKTLDSIAPEDERIRRELRRLSGSPVPEERLRYVVDVTHSKRLLTQSKDTLRELVQREPDANAQADMLFEMAQRIQSVREAMGVEWVVTLITSKEALLEDRNEIRLIFAAQALHAYLSEQHRGAVTTWLGQRAGTQRPWVRFTAQVNLALLGIRPSDPGEEIRRAVFSGDSDLRDRAIQESHTLAGSQQEADRVLRGLVPQAPDDDTKRALEAALRDR